MSLALHILASGSKANSAVLVSPDATIMVDAGLNPTACFKRMAECGVDPDSLTALCISHVHGDHAKFAGPIARRLRNIPIYCMDSTASAIDWEDYKPTLKIFKSGFRFQIANVFVSAFPVSHDVPTVAFSFLCAGKNVAIINDLGVVPEFLPRALVDCDLLAIESNHQEEMVLAGNYPASVKRRVLSSAGHLSNGACAKYLSTGLSSRTRQVVLTHLSSNNNLPAIAYLTARQALKSQDVSLSLAEQDKPLSFEA